MPRKPPKCFCRPCCPYEPKGRRGVFNPRENVVVRRPPMPSFEGPLPTAPIKRHLFSNARSLMTNSSNDEECKDPNLTDECEKEETDASCSESNIPQQCNNEETNTECTETNTQESCNEETEDSCTETVNPDECDNEKTDAECTETNASDESSSEETDGSCTITNMPDECDNDETEDESDSEETDGSCTKLNTSVASSSEETDAECTEKNLLDELRSEETDSSSSCEDVDNGETEGECENEVDEECKNEGDEESEEDCQQASEINARHAAKRSGFTRQNRIIPEEDAFVEPCLPEKGRLTRPCFNRSQAIEARNPPPPRTRRRTKRPLRSRISVSCRQGNEPRPSLIQRGRGYDGTSTEYESDDYDEYCPRQRNSTVATQYSSNCYR